ncbi:hypothetical protein LCGC14_0176450 [marine sediment metagenome]|uniref:Uncharacterized protein n=1 Tax=marine sediment metagenome TaxID=412755 RepID=A0A0F9X9Y3_9ZZZZ
MWITNRWGFSYSQEGGIRKELSKAGTNWVKCEGNIISLLIANYVIQREEDKQEMTKLKMVNGKIGHINRSVRCRLRVEGSWGFLGGFIQHCIMLNKHMNISFTEELNIQNYFLCTKCPNSENRNKILAILKDNNNCNCGNIIISGKYCLSCQNYQEVEEKN